MQLGSRIREERTSRNLTQQELGERCYVTRQTIANWEAGRTLPDIQSLKYLAAAFNTSVDALIADDAAEIVLRDAADRREMLLLLIGAAAFHLVGFLIIQGRTPAGEPALSYASSACTLAVIAIAVRFARIQSKRNIRSTRQIAAYVKGLRSVRELPTTGIQGFLYYNWAFLAVVGMTALYVVLAALMG